MKVYRTTTYIAAIMVLLFGALAFSLHFRLFIFDLSGISFSDKSAAYIWWYNCICDSEFWSNVCLSIFGGALLTMISSFLMYFHERQKTLEGFMYHTRQILRWLNKYQRNMKMDDKIRFFLDYHDFDKSAWDADYGNMHFFFEKATKGKHRTYIFNKIYFPIDSFGKAVSKRVWDFRWQLGGTGRNDAVMRKFISELEDYLLIYTEEMIPVDYDEDGKPTNWIEQSTVEPKLVKDVGNELVGHYYEILYGKRARCKGE